jgi:molybdate transport system substrate-binding protein
VVAALTAFAPTACKRNAASSAAEPLRVAAAADLAFAFKEVGAAFEKKTGHKVEMSFGSTGLMAKQISEGAPYEVFAAANVSFVDDVVKAGACRGETKVRYAQGRIVMWSPKEAPKTLEDLRDPRWSKIAVANPEHAPYGRAGKQAMTRAGVWDATSSRVVFGENVQQTLMFAQSGNADVAIVALSLATVSGGSMTPIEPSLHAPLEQAMVVCNGQKNGAKREAAEALVAFVGSPEGRAIMRRFGFLLPGEIPPS